MYALFMGIEFCISTSMVYENIKVCSKALFFAKCHIRRHNLSWGYATLETGKKLRGRQFIKHLPRRLGHVVFHICIYTYHLNFHDSMRQYRVCGADVGLVLALEVLPVLDDHEASQDNKHVHKYCQAYIPKKKHELGRNRFFVFLY